MSSVLKNGSFDVLKVSEINNTQTSLIGQNESITKRYEVLREQLEHALKAKDQAISYNAFLENQLYKAREEIKRLNEEINELVQKGYNV
jgi:septation ring formation regulator EzrA